MARALEGLRRYQEAPRQPLPARPEAAARHGGAALLDYGGSGRPIVFVPSLINPPNILDLAADRSLLRWLAAAGHRPLLLDWGWPGPERRTLDIGGHVERILLPLLEALGEGPVLVGYCLGGTMAIAAASLRPVAGLGLIAAPWRFAGFSDSARDGLIRLWQSAGPAAHALGLLPMEALQSAFWSLDPARTVAKFEHFASVDPAREEGRSFVALEDWANDGPPLTEAAAAELFEGFFREDRPGTGSWRVAGTAIDPATLRCPVLNIVSRTDRIVPAASAASIGERLELDQGHVGMIVGRRARDGLWHPLSDWLSRVGPAC